MGATDDASNGQSTDRGGASVPADGDMVRFMREEIRAAVQAEVGAITHAPPSYEPAASYGPSESTRLLGNDATEGRDPEPCDVEGNKKPQPNFNWAAWLIFASAWLVMLLSMPALCMTVDSQALSVLAFLLTLFTYGIGLVVLICIGLWQPKPPAPAETKSDKMKGVIYALFFSAHLLVSYAGFGLVIWWWLTGRAGSLWPRYQLANAFDAKITAPDALSRLTTCIQELIPGRNATIADITTCLQYMGVRNT